MKWILPLFVAWSASAQLPVIPFVVPSSSVVNSPTNLVEQALEHWWVASDLAGVTPLNYNWQDKIQSGWFWLYDTVSGHTAPSVTSVSVTFNGDATLTNNTRTYQFTSPTLHRTVVLLLKPTSGHAVSQQYFVNDSANGIAYSTGLGHVYADNLNVTTTGATASFLQDWVMTQTNLGATPNMISFTNNVQSGSGTSVGSSVTIWRFGGGPVAQPLFANVYEILCYTNKVGFGGFTNPVDLANLHKYFTNTYSFSP